MGSLGKVILPVAAIAGAVFTGGSSLGLLGASAAGAAASTTGAVAADTAFDALVGGTAQGVSAAAMDGLTAATAAGTTAATAASTSSSFLPSWMTGSTARLGLTGLQSGLSILSGNQQATAAKQQASYENEVLANNEDNSMSAASRNSEAQTMQTRQLIGTATARAAAGGGSVDAPSTQDIIGNIGAEGQYRSMLDLWNGQNQVTNDQNQITANNIEAENKANQYQMQGILSGAGTAVQNTFFSKYGNPFNSTSDDS